MAEQQEDQQQDPHAQEAEPVWGYIHRRKTDRPDGVHQSRRMNDGQQEHSEQGDKDKKEQDDNKDKDGKGDSKKDEAKKMSPQKKRTLIIIGIIVLIALIIGAILYWLHARQFEDTDDAFIDGHVSQVSPQASGRIQSLYIVDNQQVQAGDLLAEIDPRDYNVRLAQAKSQRAQAVAQVALQEANIAQSQANVHVSEAEVFQADRDLKRFQAVDPKAITKQQLDNAIANARSANAKLDASRQAVLAARAQKGVAQASVEQADVEISNAQLQLSYTRIIAPISGHITKRTVEVGNVVSSGQPLLAVVSNDLWVTANFKETQLDHMRTGQPVRIKIDAYPGSIFSGHVDSFQRGTGSVFSALPAENATGNYVKVVQRVPVKIVFDNESQFNGYDISPGLSVDPRVKVR